MARRQVHPGTIKGMKEIADTPAPDSHHKAITGIGKTSHEYLVLDKLTSLPVDIRKLFACKIYEQFFSCFVLQYYRRITGGDVL
ncbi:MAG: hypothetical protein GY752_09175 [bacterium]|nr:hypothetical protein [bacterium]